MNDPATKTIGVALVEQVGALVVTVVSAVLMQHIYATTLLHTPESSWLIRLSKWWRAWVIDQERAAYFRRMHRELGVYMRPETADEPTA